MNTYRSAKNQRGITLIAVVMVVLAIGLIAYFAGAIAVKLQQIATERNTVNRMLVIRDALKEYYRGHRDLPLDATDPTKIPVQELNLEQKYRVDAWGQFLYYECRVDSNTGTDRTDILGVQVETNPPVAAVIISLGSDQAKNYTRTAGTPITFTTTAGDVVMLVNVQDEAIHMARESVDALAKKVCSYACNGGDISSDDLDGTAVITGTGHMIERFSLNEFTFQYDPWLRPYQWLATFTPKSFRSTGPDAASTADDIYVAARLDHSCCGGTPPLPGLVGFWNFATPPAAGPGGAVDFSGQGNDGTVFSSPSNPGAQWVVGGTIGAPFPGALYFDGNDYITITSSDSLNLESDFTLAAWIMKPAGTYSPRYQKVISRRTGYSFYFLGIDQEYPYGGVGNLSGWEVTPRRGCDGVYIPESGYDFSGVNCAPGDSSFKSVPDEWVHLAFVYDNRVSPSHTPPHSMKVYISKLGDTDSSLKHYGWTNLNPGGLGGINITIGADSNGTEHFFKGYIAYVAVYNRALSQTEIQTLFDWR